jgi:TPR repeat protein
MGGLDVPQDDVQAVRWFRIAAEQGSAEARHILGLAYETGRGVPKDPIEAARWFRLAAEQGHPPNLH